MGVILTLFPFNDYALSGLEDREDLLLPPSLGFKMGSTTSEKLQPQ
jgi:hypothetical protein